MLDLWALYACSAVVIALLAAAARRNRRRGWVRPRPEPFRFPETFFAPPNLPEAQPRADRLSTEELLALSRALGLQTEANLTRPTLSRGTDMALATHTPGAASGQAQ